MSIQALSGFGIYDSNRPGFKGVLVYFDKREVIADLKNVTDGWSIAMEYKRKNGLGRIQTKRINDIFTGFDNVVIDSDTGKAIVETAANSILKKYNIVERFQFMEELISMTIAGACPSCIVTGPGGIGKTYTVMEKLKEQHYKEGEYKIVKGFTTPMGMYLTMHDNRSSIIIYDDCDSAFNDKTSENLLKAALDSNDRRIVSWNSSRLPEGVEGSFEFKGRIIFISNLPLRKFDQTLISRSYIIDLQMSREEIMDRIEHIKEKIAPAPKEVQSDVIAFMREHKDVMADLNIRTYLKILKLRLFSKNQPWEKMSEFMLCS